MASKHRYSHVVVCGGGVIGCCIAYYLTSRGVQVTIIEQEEIACSASGKAGGFLARHWCDDGLLGELARLSFDLHMELSESFGDQYSFRRLQTRDLSATPRMRVLSNKKARTEKREKSRPSGHNDDLKWDEEETKNNIPWLDGRQFGSERLGNSSNTAQVHPRQFTNTMLQAAQSTGLCQVIYGKMEGVLANDTKNESGQNDEITEKKSELNRPTDLEEIEQNSSVEYESIQPSAEQGSKGENSKDNEEKEDKGDKGDINSDSNLPCGSCHPDPASRGSVHSLGSMTGRPKRKNAASKYKSWRVTSHPRHIRAVVLSDGTQVRGDAVVFAMGPWTHEIERILDVTVPVNGERAHSIAFQLEHVLDPACALFVQYTDDNGRNVCSPEIYPRPDGEVYVCGMSDSLELPPHPSQVQVNVESCDMLQQVAASVCLSLENAPIKFKQACYVPTTKSGLPIIDSLPGITNAFVSAGHSCWGILLGPATGKAMAELIDDGIVRCVDISPFSLE